MDRTSIKVSNDSNTQKRKSDFKECENGPGSRKSNKRRRLLKQSKLQADTTEAGRLIAQAAEELETLPIPELQKVFILQPWLIHQEDKRGSIKQPKDSHSRSKVARTRSSVSQFFKGAIWEPPVSTTRTRRPPSQWWVP